MLLLRWLRQVVLQGPVIPEAMAVRPGTNLVTSPPQPSQKVFFENILIGSEAALEFFHLLHTGGLWLRREQALQMAQACRRVCQTYAALARAAHEIGLPRFHLEPMLHTFQHFEADILSAVAKGCSRMLSPVVSTCEGDEDFVGRVARCSRNVHGKKEATCKRTLDRYLLRCHFEFQEISQKG